MKKIITIVLFLVSIGNIAFAQYPQFINRYEGVIGDIPVSMHLAHNYSPKEANVTGTYFYKSKGAKNELIVYADSIDRRGKFMLTETDGNEITGYFKGKISEDQKIISGIWTNADETKSLAFELNRKEYKGDKKFWAGVKYKPYSYFNECTLVIGDVNDSCFAFVASGISGLRTGEISGYAFFTSNYNATFHAEEDNKDCVINFNSYSDNSVNINNTNIVNSCGFEAGVNLMGNYTNDNTEHMGRTNLLPVSVKSQIKDLLGNRKEGYDVNLAEGMAENVLDTSVVEHLVSYKIRNLPEAFSLIAWTKKGQVLVLWSDDLFVAEKGESGLAANKEIIKDGIAGQPEKIPLYYKSNIPGYEHKLPVIVQSWLERNNLYYRSIAIPAN